MNMFPIKRADTVKCGYCGYVAPSTYELLTRHVCHRMNRFRNMVSQSSEIYRPVIKKTTTQALKSIRLPSARQTNVRDIFNNVRNDSKEIPSKVHYGFQPPLPSSQSTPLSPWSEVVDESEIPLSVLEKMEENESLSDKNNLRNNGNFAPKRATVYRNFPAKFSEKVTEPMSLQVSSVDQESSFDAKPLIMNPIPNLKSVSEPSSTSTHIMLVSPISKEIAIVSLDDVMNELDERMKELPYEIRLRLEYEFLQNVYNAIDEEQSRTNTV